MHIVYETSEFVTEKKYGGLATYLYNISDIMSRHRHKVTIITLSENSGRIKLRENIDVIRVKKKQVRGASGELELALNMLENSWQIRKCLNKLMQEDKIDIVQAANYKAVGFFRSRKLPTVVRASSDSAMWRNAANREFDYEKTLHEKKLEDYLELWCIKHAEAAFAPSRFCANILGMRAGAKVYTVESPYPAKDIKMDDSLYIEKLHGKKYLLFNSSLSYMKGTHVGIDAIDYLLEKYPDLYMVFAGSDYGLRLPGGGVQSIAAILKKKSHKYGGRVMYLGVLTHETLFPVVKNSIACVLPSRVDNLPNSCIEAMSMGKIVIGTYGASFEQLITNKKNGLLIKRDSDKALTKAVDYLMEMSEEQRLFMGDNAARTVERLDPDAIYEKVMKLYIEAIKKHR